MTQAIREKLSELRALCDSATPGPFIIQRFDWDGGDINYQVESEDVTAKQLVVASVLNKKVDAQFIARARTALPEALDALEALLEGCEIGRDRHDNLCLLHGRYGKCDCHSTEVVKKINKAAKALGVEGEK